MVAGMVWLTRSRALDALAIALGLPIMAIVSWWPIGAALSHTF